MTEPKLRFKDENGKDYPEWETSKMESLGYFDKGRILSKADISETGIPMILYGELYTHYNEVAYEIQRKTEHDAEGLYISKGGEVILPCSGETPEDISTATCVMVPGVALGGDLIIFSSYEIDGRIMSYILNHPMKYKIASVAQGKSVVHISASSIEKLDINYPVSKEEQQKIADLLSSVDEVISTLTEEVRLWEEKKKGVMQKIFSQEIRFKDENGNDYPEVMYKNITEVADTFIGLVTTMTENYVEEGIPLIRNSDIKENKFVFKSPIYLDVKFAEKNKSRKHQTGDIITVHTGDVGTSAVIEEELDGSIGFATIVTRLKNQELIMPKYVSWYFNSPVNKRIINNMITGDGRNNLNMKDFNKLIIPIPCLAEQQKIADCLTAIDEVIALKKQKLETWKNIKKGLLQQMFV